MWTKLETFYHIVKAGSLVGAAKILNTDQPTLSSKLATIERNFGFKLINRSTPHKPLSLTRKGEEVFKVAEKTYMLIREMNTKLYDDDSLSGNVRISTTSAITNYIIGPILSDFAEKYPDIGIEIICNDKKIDIIGDEIDLAIGTYIEDNPAISQEYLFTLRSGLYASQSYIEKFGKPQTIDDLDNHRILVFSKKAEPPYSEIHWPLKLGRKGKKIRKPFYAASSVEHILSAAEKGLGIVSSYGQILESRKSNLIPILEEAEGPEYKDYIIFPKNLKETKRVMLVKNFIIENLGQAKELKKDR